MSIRRSWADDITVERDDDALVLTGVRLLRAKTDLLAQGYASSKVDKDSRPLHLRFTELSEADGIATTALRYGALYGDLIEHSFPSLSDERFSDKTSSLSSTGTGGSSKNIPFVSLVVKQHNSLVLQEIGALRAFITLLEAARREDYFMGSEQPDKKQPGYGKKRLEVYEKEWLEEHVNERLEYVKKGVKYDEKRLKYESIAEQLSILANQTKTWQSQLDAEITSRRLHGLAPDPGWSWSAIAQDRLDTAASNFFQLTGYADDELPCAEFMNQPQEELRLVVTTVLNAFPPLLAWGSEIVQHPGADLIFGIRPLIYHMIREDLLTQTEIRLCRNKSCGRFFRANRRDQTCCSPECSERVRFRKYYETKRKPQRQARNTATELSGEKGPIGGKDVPS